MGRGLMALLLFLVVAAVLVAVVWLIVRFIRKGETRKSKVLRSGLVFGSITSVAAAILAVAVTNATWIVYRYDIEPVFEHEMRQLEKQAKETDDETMWKYVNRYHESKQLGLWIETEWHESSATDRLDLIGAVSEAELGATTSIEYVAGLYRDEGNEGHADKLLDMVLEREAEMWWWLEDAVYKITNSTEYRMFINEAERTLDRQTYNALVDSMDEMEDVFRERAKLTEAGKPWRGWIGQDAN